MTRTAVVGAGFCGLLVGRALVKAGDTVTLFDKGRGPGGRMGTRRWDRDDPSTPTFDHGVVSCTPEAAGFRALVDEFVRAGLMAAWDPRMTQLSRSRFVATPTWGALARVLAKPLEVRTGCRVESLHGGAGEWSLALEDGSSVGPFDRVLLTIPGPQAAKLLGPVSAALAAVASRIPTTRCWTAMLRFSEPVAAPLDLVESSDPAAVVRSAARESSRPGRPGHSCWTVQAGPEWSQAWWEREPVDIAAALQEDLARVLGQSLPALVEARAHRWGFADCGAMVADAEGPEALLEKGLGLAGDGLGKGTSGLETAWSSAQQMIRLAAGSPEPSA